MVPFTEDDFSIPEHNWTLLVTAVDHYLPAAKKLLSAFALYPIGAWMILWPVNASDQGSVGPHYDNYDVFLIQGVGQRRWLTGQYCQDNEALLDHPDLKVLQQFHKKQEYLLKAGDILYLPPRIAHLGYRRGTSHDLFRWI